MALPGCDGGSICGARHCDYALIANAPEHNRDSIASRKATCERKHCHVYYEWIHWTNDIEHGTAFGVRPVKYRNKIVDQDHRAKKRIAHFMKVFHV
jgi:transposase-like protein